MKVLAIADDLTGALEAGAKFAAQGTAAIVTVDPHLRTASPVVVVDSESRHLSEREAAERVRLAMRPGRLVYKKTDSTLRGNIRAELEAIVECRPGSRVAYIGAYPAVGRTVRGGVLHVDGVPVRDSAFAGDALNPVRHGSIAEMLRGLPCDVFDGETQADVRQAVECALAGGQPAILAGPASVAAALAELLDLPRDAARALPRVESCVVVSGSRHQASVRQLAWAEAHACAAWQVMRPRVEAGAEAHQAAIEIGAQVARRIESTQCRAVMVFGGDTAFGILKALGSPLLAPVGEVLPGVAVSQVVGRDLVLITKAGGFGDEDVVERVREKLNANA